MNVERLTIFIEDGRATGGYRVARTAGLSAAVSVPPDFMDALDRDADAKRFFDGLSYSNKQRFVLSIEGAKTAETRQRRIAKAVSECLS